VLIGATQGIGREMAAEYARQGANVVITGRTAERATDVAGELSKNGTGTVTGLPLDLTRPGEIVAALTAIGRVDRLVIIGMIRDHNSLADYNVARAIDLAVTKVVGYTAVVSALAPRLAPDASIVLFGGMAKEYPHPGSTTVSAVNAAVTGLVRTMSVELSPVRVNAIHTGPIEDSPYWTENPAMLDTYRKLSLTGRLGTMSDVVNACVFLLESPIANGIDLHADGGRRR
jgi:NAD(P)-dependent dehydrogenase (short-subunit alcohol dehydrogenase family)